MAKELNDIPEKVKESAPGAVAAILRAQGNPNQRITIFRATVGDSINSGDWVFLDRNQADRWTRTAFGRPKPGVKVLTMTVKASQVDWTRKNLEFVYVGK